MRDGAINFEAKLARFSEHWSPRVIAEMNDYQFKLAKFQGEFVWHSHAESDEVFIVLSGAMALEFRDGTVPLAAGEMYVVPKGRTPPGGAAGMLRAAGRAARRGQHGRRGRHLYRAQRRVGVARRSACVPSGRGRMA